MDMLFVSVEVRRDGAIELLQRSTIENSEFSPWSTLVAELTSTQAVFSTDPVEGPVLHFQRMLPFNAARDEMHGSALHSIKVGGQNCKLLRICIIRELHVMAIVAHDIEEDEEAFDGHWFGTSEPSFEAIVYHIPTRQEIYRCSLPPETLSVNCECEGDTLAMNVSHLGFVLTGGNVSDVARAAAAGEAVHLASPSGKKAKEKKKRMVSGATGRKNKSRGPRRCQR